jgi:hypothetical protein
MSSAPFNASLSKLHGIEIEIFIASYFLEGDGKSTIFKRGIAAVRSVSGNLLHAFRYTYRPEECVTNKVVEC